jgi:hypothetical protein
MKMLRNVLLSMVISFAFCLGALWAEQLSTGIDDQKSVEITVYNSNIGLVKDLRSITLPKGIQELKFMDIASQIIPTSVSIRSPNHPDSLVVLEQNYEYDLLSPRKLLDKYVGKNVKIRSKNPYTDKEEIVAATVMSNNEGVPVFKINNEITYGYQGNLLFPEIPENLISKPTLMWLLEGKQAGPQVVEAVYLTNGITWQADYVLLLNDKDTETDLSGWVTINNRSGTTYKNARLKLVAGDVNRVADEVRPPRPMLKAGLAMAEGAPQFKEAAFFEYHIYTLQRPSTIKENQTKQISLLDAQRVPVKKEFLYRGMPEYYRNRLGDTVSTKKVEVFVELANRKENHLGMPIPKGIMRVYKHDEDGSLQFVGEDTIEHTPKDEKIKVKLGNAFDIVATRKQTAWERIGGSTYEVAFEVTLRNHKKEDVTVRVVEPMSGDWKILESSHHYKKVDVATLSFDLPVKKDGETRLTYRARIKY